MSTSNVPQNPRWQWLPAPVRIGLVAGALGLALAVVGILRGNVPLNPLSILLALLISGVSWGVVAWAIAVAAFDVESDLASSESDHDDLAEGSQG